ncbi:MAG: hypothetical protein MJ025_03955 [Victivallaceae bacterium]|nr:hypothetical protein [Victivallaceae bacterium]
MTSRYVALDIGNVCVRINHAAIAAGMARPSIGSEVLEIATLHECGKIGEDEFFERLMKTDAIAGIPRQAIEKAFDNILVEPVDGMADLIEKMTKIGLVPVYISDISPRHLERCRRIFPASDMVKYGIYSFEVGYQKPSPEMFKAFESRFGKPLVYADDRLELVEAATAFGWNAVQFKDAGALAGMLGLGE